jgi:hypothetical protein
VAEFEMRVRVDQAGQERHIPKVLERCITRRPANGNDLRTGHLDDAVSDRWTIDRQHVTGF